MTFWTNEKLQQAALDEALRHGASRDDVGRLRELFRQRAVEKYQTPLIPDDADTHTAEV